MRRIDQLVAKIDGSAGRLYLLIASPVIAVFFIIPLQLFCAGRGYVNWSRLVPVGFVLAGFCLYLLLAAVVWILLKRSPQWAYVFSTAMFWLGLYALLSDIFVPPQISPLNGHPLVSRQPLNRTVEQAVLFFLVAVAAFRLPLYRRFRLGLFTVAFLLVISLSYGAIAAVPHHPATAGVVNVHHNTAIRGNVYHILLDELQGNVALRHLRDKKNMDAFPGFTFFRNTISNYLYTYQSFHSYFTGTVYDGVHYKEWIDGYKTGGLLGDLRKKGYRITEYTPAFYDWTEFPAIHFTSGEIFEEEYKSQLCSLKDFVEIWLARVMPNFRTNAALAAGRSLGARIEASVAGPSDVVDVPTSDLEGIHPFSAVLTIKRAIKDEARRDANGEYVYLHALVPHMPYVLDDQCRYRPEWGTSPYVYLHAFVPHMPYVLDDQRRHRPGWNASPTERYDAQAACALNLVSQFLDTLKALGRYDDATIIIQSDHGSVLGPRQDDESRPASGGQAEENGGPPFLDNQFGWSKNVIRGRIMATLMIKPPKSVHPFEVSEEPAQLVDIYPSLAALLGLEGGQKEVAGCALFNGTPPPSRQFSFYVTPCEVEKPPDVIAVDVANPHDLFRSPLTVSGSVSRRETAYLSEKGISFDFGAPTEAGMWLSGFWFREEEGSAGQNTYFRWAGGKESKLRFLGVQTQHQSRILLDFEIQPYYVMRGRKMLIKSPLSTADIVVKPGWNSYRVALDFPMGEDLAVTVEYEKSATPRALGYNANDDRELSVRWRRIGLSYAPDGPHERTDVNR